ncbi:MAG TPA: endonuclease/exonuclease/phosphatase family protein [Chitinophagales bacterium]|nr:endonuclease/exonuclease/phosphatase family protein [Chitinophagales bacterium]
MKYLKWLLSFTSRTVNIVFVVLLFISLSASYFTPEKLWFLAFAGMLLPLLLIINSIFVVVWILRKRHFAIVSILAIAACLPQIFRLFASNIGQPKIENISNQAIKVLSYNVRDFDLYNWSENEKSKEIIFKTLKEKDADVICFQEFYNDTSKEFNTIKQLHDIGYPYYYFTREVVLRNSDEWGIAIFSKTPIAEHGTIMKQSFKTGYGKKPFKGLYADITINNKVIRFINVHLQSIYFGEKEYETIADFKETQNLDEHGAKNIFRKLKRGFERRVHQADELRTFIDNQKMPLVVCGDFNDLPNSYVINTVSKNLKDAFIDYGFGIGHTYNGNIPFLRIDYIFCSQTINVQKFEIINNKISDHYPIYSELSLP